MVRPLAKPELLERARRVRLVVSDVDGVLTDSGVYYSERGEELVRFSRRDGMGVELLEARGVATAWLTRERSPIVLARAKKLGIQHLYAGARNKREHFAALLASANVQPAEVAYIGDDVNDIEVIDRVVEVGLCGAPADAHPEVLRRVHFISEAPGGHGAFRQFADHILSLKSEEHA